MPELQMDVAVANRFISSLSKSLQALCHGCMDFDSGIEIVGYINVNIDSGSKVDYVLNEKVLKSTTNSMTFVSNSFLARKEQQKHTRDGACSPVQDIINQQTPVMTQFQNRIRGALHGLHPRNAAPFSSVHHSSQKRSWAAMERDWRMTPKKQRDGRQPYSSPLEPTSTAPNPLHSHSVSSKSSQNLGDANFKWPQTSTQGSDTNKTDGQPEINIKTEICDSDIEKTVSQHDQDQSHTSDQETNDNAEETSMSTNVNIKVDPDASTTAADEETHTSDGTANDTNTDFKGTFLEPSTSEDNQDNAEQSRNQADTEDDNQLSNIGPSELTGKTRHNVETDNPGESAASADLSSENVTPGTEMPVEYDEAGEEGAYPQSVYSDAGEGSSDAGQFEVIEIDDEDEDVQAMFGGSQRKVSHTGPALPHLYSYQSTPHHSGQARPSEPMLPLQMSRPQGIKPINSIMIPESSVQCNFCHSTLETRSMFQKHMNECHREKNALPFTCSMCQKGFFSLTGLRHHIEAHGGRQFVCTVCDARFQHKHNLKRHIVGVHKLRECPSCNITINDGPEYNIHVLRCGTGSQFSYIPKP